MRKEQAASLLELVVAAVIMVAAFAMIGEIVVTTTQASTKLANCIDGVTGANLFLQRLTDDMHTASAFGLPSDKTLINSEGGYPSSADGWAQSNGPTALVLQQPVLQNTGSSIDGVPLTAPSTGTPYIDVVGYQVLPDPNYQNHFFIQEVRCSGVYSVPNTSRLAIPLNPSHTVLRGLTSDQVFTVLPSSTGVAVSLSLQMPLSNTGTNRHTTVSKSVIFFRGNMNVGTTPSYSY